MQKLLLLLGLTLLLAGCYHSRVVEVHITNQSAGPIRNVEVVYIGGSYGASQIAAGVTHTYRVKPFGDAELDVKYIDAAGQARHRKGPLLRKGDEGTVEIVIAENTFASHATLKAR